MTTTPSEPVQDPDIDPRVTPSEDPSAPQPEDPEKPHGDPLTNPEHAESGQMPDHDTEIGA